MQAEHEEEECGCRRGVEKKEDIGQVHRSGFHPSHYWELDMAKIAEDNVVLKECRE